MGSKKKKRRRKEGEGTGNENHWKRKKNQKNDEQSLIDEIVSLLFVCLIDYLFCFLFRFRLREEKKKKKKRIDWKSNQWRRKKSQFVFLINEYHLLEIN